MKNILLVDDSALMRRVLCDIIESDKRFRVQDRAVNGLDALSLLSRKTYDAVVLDVNMPQMNGLELLKELQKRKISAKIIMASTDTADGAKVTLDALDIQSGAVADSGGGDGSGCVVAGSGVDSAGTDDSAKNNTGQEYCRQGGCSSGSDCGPVGEKDGASAFGQGGFQSGNPDCSACKFHGWPQGAAVGDS